MYTYEQTENMCIPLYMYSYSSLLVWATWLSRTAVAACSTGWLTFGASENLGSAETTPCASMMDHLALR